MRIETWLIVDHAHLHFSGLKNLPRLLMNGLLIPCACQHNACGMSKSYVSVYVDFLGRESHNYQYTWRLGIQTQHLICQNPAVHACKAIEWQLCSWFTGSHPTQTTMLAWRDMMNFNKMDMC